MREFRYRQLQFEDELVCSLSAALVTGECAWVPKGNDPMACESPAGNDVDLESRTNFLESLDTRTVSNLPDNMDELKQARKRKMKKVAERTSPRSRNSAEGDISKCVESFTEWPNR